MTADRGDGWADYCARADAQRDEAETRATWAMEGLAFQLGKNREQTEALLRLRDLLRADLPARSPKYALACRDAAHAIDAIIEGDYSL